jgi:hypothetical protein
MDYVTVSRKAGQLKGYLSTNAMRNLISAIQKARSFDDLDPLYQSWLEDRKNVATHYLSETAKRAAEEKGQGAAGLPDDLPLGLCTERDWRSLDDFDIYYYAQFKDEGAIKEGLRRGILKQDGTLIRDSK